MKLKSLLSAASLLLAVSAASATTSLDVGRSTVTYDETTSLGYAGSFNSLDYEGVDWNLPASVTLTNSEQGTIKFRTVDLPSFTIEANPGFALSNLTGFLGNPTFFDYGGTSNIAFTGDISVNGGAPIHIQDALIDFVITGSTPSISLYSGYFAATETLPGPFTSFSLTNASLLLTAAVAPDGVVSSIIANPQNKLEISYNVVAVPEPETAAMLLAGLAAMGWVAQRRRSA